MIANESCIGASLSYSSQEPRWRCGAPVWGWLTEMGVLMSGVTPNASLCSLLRSDLCETRVPIRRESHRGSSRIPPCSWLKAEQPSRRRQLRAEVYLTAHGNDQAEYSDGISDDHHPVNCLCPSFRSAGTNEIGYDPTAHQWTIIDAVPPENLAADTTDLMETIRAWLVDCHPEDRLAVVIPDPVT